MKISVHQVSLVLAALCWGGSATFTKFALDGLPPMLLLTAQLGAAVAVLWTALLVRGFRRTPVTARLVLLGLFEPGLAYAFFTFGLARTTAANASLLTGLESFFAIAMACVFLRERLTARGSFALLLALAGVATLEGAGTGLALHLGDVLVLVGVLCAASYVVYASRVADEVDALTMTTYQFTFGLLFTAPVALACWLSGAERLPSQVSAASWGAALLSGVVGYALSFLLYNFAIRSVPATTASAALNLIPVFGLACAVGLLGERLTVPQGLGAALIIGSVLLFPAEQADPAKQADPADPVDALETVAD
ncbi:DMT family transporter [Kitasatospora sp. McL0602]|uniref:DMT family transporter n=1 Tax=Kitasatospora sp. McL0602 TaxID=3439530 RepID=UPI003F893889